MASDISPCLTRFDVVLAMLRMQFWASCVMLGHSLLLVLTAFALNWVPRNVSEVLYGPGLNAVPVLLLLLFSRLLAVNALGDTRMEPVSSWAEIRPLIGRSVGLWLVVYSVGNIVLSVGRMAYNAMIGAGNSIFKSFAPITQLELLPLLEQGLVFLLGFFLAFGPAIRDNFRAR